MIGILIIAHAPLASALRDCALHVYPECASGVQALDILPNASPDESLRQAKAALTKLNTSKVLMLSDVFGATPSNVAQKLNDGIETRLLAGVNLPMLLRSVCYRHESLDALTSRAQAGGAQGIIPVGCTAPQNQSGPRHAPSYDDHQQ
ncbi:MAG: PTS fructose transporter subunit IIA [Betaproteobacteria bacterium]|jgi:PTS system ascorbate-specific IIA component|nr:PTS fructose transporter subunit IIA [Betaproteobacteria bacterium]NDB43050.1 PTS fructose transporter subunit IIA [Betaproteobacteria bacterium]NDD00958.1 PTS fructose transporter subunit IIA [Betaproteobacteria bacterium]NDD22974.1 PTS fructose transporter subunit IIA [Betaproteobacteria bacterium]NDE24510.1 PTS fructose transporter subunit IIA [Betaproteobacteria bacterium]